MGSANLLEAEIADTGSPGQTTIRAGGLTLRASGVAQSGRKRALVCIRPETVLLADEDGGENVFTARVRRVSFLGASLNCELDAGGLTLRADMPARTRIAEGDEASFRIAPDCVVLVPDDEPAESAVKITSIAMQEYRWPRTKPITNGKHTYTHVDYALVKIGTDQGITGIGLGHGGAIERAIIDHLAAILIGEDPVDVERLWHKMWVPKLVGRRGLTTRAISAIDIGLWDIRAKAANMPLWKMLGGFRDRVPTYVAGGYYEEGKGLRELAQEMEDNVRMGARAVKMKVGGVPIARGCRARPRGARRGRAGCEAAGRCQLRVSRL